MTGKVLYITLELGVDKWVLGFATQAAEKPRFRQMPAGRGHGAGAIRG